MTSITAATDAVGALSGWDPAGPNELHDDLVNLPQLPEALRDALAHIGDWLAECAHLNPRLAEACHAAAVTVGSAADDLEEAGVGLGITGKGGGTGRGGADPRPDWVRDRRPVPRHQPMERPAWVDERGPAYGNAPRPPPVRPPPPAEPQMRRRPEDPPDDDPPPRVREPRRPPPGSGPSSTARRVPERVSRWLAGAGR